MTRDGRANIQRHVSHLQLGLGLSLSVDGALYQTVGVGLRSKHFGILSSVLQSLVPAQVCDTKC